MKVSCLGPTGSYSHLAAQELCGDCEILFCHDFYKVMEVLVNGISDYAVLPIENSIRGGVLLNFDLLSQYDVFEIRETILSIDHRLAMLKGVKMEEIECVYSHEQAIGQCSNFLQKCLPNAKLLYANSTAESLSGLDRHTAGIVGAHVKAKDVVLSSENIANEKNNYTRFMLLERMGKLPVESSKILFVAVTEHEPGALVKLLQIFARHGINLSRIESRPIPSEFGQYRFFIELDGNIADTKVSVAFDEARALCRYFRLLGAYHATKK